MHCLPKNYCYKMKNLIPSVLMCLSTWICGQFIEIIWVYLILIFIISWVYSKKGMYSFWLGFISVSIVWGIQMVLKDLPNQGVLSGNVAELFPMKSRWFIYILTLLAGALPAGLISYSAKLIKGNQ